MNPIQVPEAVKANGTELLAELLLADPAVRRVYRDSALGRAMFDTLVQSTIPTMLAGIITRADSEEARLHQSMIDLASQHPAIVVTREQARQMGLIP